MAAAVERRAAARPLSAVAWGVAIDVAAYLDLLGEGADRPADLDTLRRLHAAHLRTVPFENQSILGGSPVVIDEAAFVAKVVEQRRGGFCYELNGAFGALLDALGYRVERLSARVHQGSAGPGRPFEHLALRVTVDGEPWLADVGFGFCFLHPLRVLPGMPQDDPHGRFELRPADDGDLDLLWEPGDGKQHPQYRLALDAHPLDAFAERCHHQSTDPASVFTSGLIYSKATEWGGATLFQGQLIHYRDGKRTERSVPPEEVGDVLRSVFGVEPEA